MFQKQMRQTGRLIQWDQAKGYGFIAPAAGGAKLFVHIKAFGPRASPPALGEVLSYDLGVDAQGKTRALKVRGAVAEQAPPPTPAHANGQVWLVPAFAALYLLLHLHSPLPPFLWGGYMAMSLATFIVYLGDKRAARLGQWRVSEKTLHVLALACGWPGALLAQQLLAHKRAKPAFRRMFWLTVIVNIAALLLFAQR